MLAEPKVEHWQEKPYAAIRTRVAMMAVPKDLPPLIFEVLNWVKKITSGKRVLHSFGICVWTMVCLM